MHNELNFIIG